MGDRSVTVSIPGPVFIICLVITGIFPFGNHVRNGSDFSELTG